MSEIPSREEFPGPIASDYDGPSLLQVKSLADQQLQLACEMAIRTQELSEQVEQVKAENAQTVAKMQKNHQQIIRILDDVVGSIARRDRAAGR